MSLKSLSLGILGFALFVFTLALAITASPSKANAGLCWFWFCNTDLPAVKCPKDALPPATNCTNCDASGTFHFCAQNLSPFNFCWETLGCKGTATNRAGSACFCIARGFNACNFLPAK